MTRRSILIAGLAALTLLLGRSQGAPEARVRTRMVACKTPLHSPVRIEAGAFAMGSIHIYAEEGPVRQTTVEGFWIDPHEVTNLQFANFVAATGYITRAERPVDPAQFPVPPEEVPERLLQPGSAVFTPPATPSNNYADWWKYMPGASWKKPYGPGGPDAVANEPVVHLAWDDMAAYAEWRGGRLPTEAEWEFAAKGQRPVTTKQPDPHAANSWQGVFPVKNLATDGFKGIAPVGCFMPNAFGLYDMVGNVWEVTSDFYRPGHDPLERYNPLGPDESDSYDPLNPGSASRTVKGGSFLCAPNYCQRYRPESRQGRDTGLGASNVGFRLVYDAAPQPEIRRRSTSSRSEPNPVAYSILPNANGRYRQILLRRWSELGRRLPAFKHVAR